MFTNAHEEQHHDVQKHWNYERVFTTPPEEVSCPLRVFHLFVSGWGRFFCCHWLLATVDKEVSHSDEFVICYQQVALRNVRVFCIFWMVELSYALHWHFRIMKRIYLFVFWRATGRRCIHKLPHSPSHFHTSIDSIQVPTDWKVRLLDDKFICQLVAHLNSSETSTDERQIRNNMLSQNYSEIASSHQVLGRNKVLRQTARFYLNAAAIRS